MHDNYKIHNLGGGIYMVICVAICIVCALIAIFLIARKRNKNHLKSNEPDA